jgi:RNA polymerase sigma factor (sigma-70 family)
MDSSELKAELERLHAASFGWAMSCCRHNHAEAEEVLQSVYLKILEGKARFAGECKLQTWLFSVIRKTAISERRKTLVRTLANIPNGFQSSESEPSVDPGVGPEGELERSQMQQRFRLALETLPRRQRETLHLVFYQDLSLREAAKVMGLSIGSARRHYERGKEHLRQALDAEEVGYEVVWRRKENSGAVS